MCSDKTLYTGWTNNLDKRLKAHNFSKTGAKYTKARRPVKFVYIEKFKIKSDAMKREWEIKQMDRREKQLTIKSAILSLY